MSKKKHKLKKAFNANLVVLNCKRMWPFIKPFWVRALIGASLTIPVGGLDAVVAMALKPFMDQVMIDKQQSVSNLIPLLIP